MSNLRAQLKITLRESNKKYFNETLPAFLKSSPQQFCRYFSDKKEGIDQIKNGSETVTEKTQISDCFNVFFHSVFAKTRAEHGNDERNELGCCAMGPLEITQAGMFQQLLALDTKKASGPDGISVNFCGDMLNGCHII